MKASFVIEWENGRQEYIITLQYELSRSFGSGKVVIIFGSSVYLLQALKNNRNLPKKFVQEFISYMDRPAKSLGKKKE